MKSKMMRALALIMGLLLLCPLLLCIGALRTDAAKKTQFIFDALSSGQSSYETTNGEQLKLPLSSNSVLFTAQNVTTVGAAGKTNALYIVLINQSNAQRVSVKYGYFLDEPKENTVSHVLSTSDQPQTIVLEAPYIAERRADSPLSVSFECDGTPTGSVTLLAFYDVSVYRENEASNEAQIEECVYSAEDSTIKISGKVSFSTAMYYEGADLALFTLSAEDANYLSKKTDVGRTEMDQSFEFTVSAKSAEEIFARYLVAVITETGERVPLCKPVYPHIPTADSSTSPGFKGFHTDSLFSVIDSGAGIEIVDVYLDQLQTTQDSGKQFILYPGDEEYYYFDTAVIDALDRRVKNLSGAGSSVYLRFLVSGEANGLSFVTHTDSSAGIVNKGIDIKDEASLRDVYALTDFLTNRYTQSASGKIEGIILGRCADRSSTYAYLGEQPLAEYAQKYAVSLGLISGAAQKNIPNLQIVVPISDRMHTGGILTDHLNGDYFSDLFLRSLLTAMDDMMLTPPTISIMLESNTLPKLLGDENHDSYGIDDIGSFMEMLSGYGATYPFLSTEIFYAWTPLPTFDEDILNAAYALQYITLFQRKDVCSFIVDLSLLSTSDRQRVTEQLYYLVSSIDTSKNTRVLESIFSAVNVNPLEVFSKYDPIALQKRLLLQANMQEGQYPNSIEAMGSYTLFGFSSTTDLLGWYGGNACEELSVQNHALTASMIATGAKEYAEIAYHFDGVKDYSFAPLMRVSLGITSSADTPYEVRISLLGKNRVLTTSAVILSGEDHEFFLDFSQYTGSLSNLSAIRIAVRPMRDDSTSYQLRLNSIKMESTSLTDAALAERFAAVSNMNQFENNQDEKRDYTTPILVSVLIFIASAALATFLIIKQRRHSGGKEKKSVHTENTGE